MVLILCEERVCHRGIIISFFFLLAMVGLLMSDIICNGVQILIFELASIISICVMFYVSIGTFFVGLGSLTAYYCVVWPIKQVFNYIILRVNLLPFAVTIVTIALCKLTFCDLIPCIVNWLKKEKPNGYKAHWRQKQENRRAGNENQTKRKFNRLDDARTQLT